MRIGSLFSGIGGLELGLEWAGIGHTVWQVEQSAYCRAVLAQHWPDAQRFDDVKTVGFGVLPVVDLICGGFPCQDVSSTGKRAGLSGARSGLWFEYVRIMGELRPAWVVVENVASGADMWVDDVIEDLAQQGYACLPIPLAAADVGAPQARARIFVVAAHVDAKGESIGAEHAKMGRASATGTGGSHWRSAQPNLVRVVPGFSRRLDNPKARIAALGNAVVPQCAEVIGHVIRRLCEGGKP